LACLAGVLEVDERGRKALPGRRPTFGLPLDEMAMQLYLYFQ
jgi:hypothetical protein